jgi:hypothetical protein
LRRPDILSVAAIFPKLALIGGAPVSISGGPGKCVNTCPALTNRKLQRSSQMAATVLPLNKSAQKTIPATRRGTRVGKALRRQAGTAIGIGAVAVTLTALSLSHLAHGVEIVTGSTVWESWAMAVGIDLGFVALELSQLAINNKVRKQVGRFAGRRSSAPSPAAPR